MGISILGIISVQLVWMNNAMRVKNELFGRSVNEALNSTVLKLEDIHNFGVVNRMVFADSVHWISGANNNFDIFVPPPPDLIHEFDSSKIPSRPIKIIREISPDNKNTRVEIKVDSDNKKTVQSYAFSFDFDTDSSNLEHIILNPEDTDKNIYFLQKDSLVTDIDSFYSSGLVKIDSIITGLDTFAVIAPDISKRVELKAHRLKTVAKQVVTEISAWDVQTIDTDLIKNVLAVELKNKDIPIDFEFGVIQDTTFLATDSLVTDSVKLMNTDYRVDLYPNDIIQKNMKLAVYFPGRESFIYRSLNWLLVTSFLFSVIILLTFALSIFYILRQKKISEMKSDFINNMTHEFKTPIATISVATDSITNEKVVNDVERIRYFAGMIKKENNRMNRQVEDILTIARLDKKDFEFTWGTVDIHELIEDAVQSIILQVEKRGGKITGELVATNPIVTTDKIHCTNIIYNLLDNANKYSAEKPEITIKTTNKPKGVVVSVEDKGIGMSKAVQSKIFERFYRQTSGNVHNVKGFGLGLSYVKAVIEANRGTISVQSEPGKGSRFDLFIPFVKE